MSRRREELLARLSQLHGRGAWAELLSAAEEATRELPGDSRILCYLADALRLNKRLEESLLRAAEAAEADPKECWAWTIRSRCLQDLRRDEESYQAAREAIARAPNDMWVQIRLSRMAQLTGRVEEAQAAAKRAVVLRPRDPNAWENQGWVAKKRKRWSEAEQAYKGALALSPGTSRWLVDRGFALRRLGRREEALRCYREAIEASPDWVYGYSGLGGALEEAGKLEEAIEVVIEARRLHPDNPMLLGMHARLVGKRDPEAALTLAQEMTERFPEEPDGHCYLALFYDDLDLHDEAIAAAREARRVRPGYSWALSLLSYLLGLAGQEEESVEVAEELTERSPSSGWALRTRIHRLDTVGRRREAMELAALCAERFDKEPETWDILAGEFLKWGWVEEALQATERLRELAPEDATSWEQSSWVALHVGDKRSLRLYLEEAKKRAFDQAWVRQHEAIGHLAEGRYHEAKEGFEAGLMEGFATCGSVCFLGVCCAHLGDRREAARIRDGGRVGPSRARRCPDPNCLNLRMLERALEETGW